MTLVTPMTAAPLLRCPCCPDAPMEFQGMYGPRSDRFARFLCAGCQASYPERSNIIAKQLRAIFASADV